MTTPTPSAALLGSKRLLLVKSTASAIEAELLKATVSKTIVVPAYTRKDGVVVPAHTKVVHYDPSKDVGDVLSGKGSHSQKQAHKKLSKLGHWESLEDSHKLAHILSSATNIQQKASASAAVSGWKASMLAGKKPTASQQAAFDALPADKQAALQAEVGKPVAAPVAAPVTEPVAATPAYQPVPNALGGLGNEGPVIHVDVSDYAAAESALGLEPGALADEDSTTYTVKNAAGQTFSVYKHGGGLSVRTSGANKDKASAHALADHLTSIGKPAEAAPAAVPLVAGADGQPKVFYHGGTGNVDSADLKPLTFFTSDKDTALSYVGNNSEDEKLHAVHLAIGKVATPEDVKAAANKVGLTGDDVGVDEEYHAGYEYLSPHLNPHVEKVLAELKKQGFDGAHFPTDFKLSGELMPGGSWVVFGKGQVVPASGDHGLQGVGAWAHLSQYKSQHPMFITAQAKAWLAENPGKGAELSSTLVDLGHLDIAKKLGIYTPPNWASLQEKSSALAGVLKDPVAAKMHASMNVSGGWYANLDDASKAKWLAENAKVPLHTFPGAGGFQAEVRPGTGGTFIVSVKDTDSGEYLPTVKKFPDEAGAVDHAKKLSGAYSEAYSSDDSGPKEGDTKPAADGGTLVLKDGHWVKQGGDAPAAKGDVFVLNSQYEKMNAGKWVVYNVSPDGEQVYMHKVGASVPNGKNSATIPVATLQAAIAKGTAKKEAPAASSTLSGYKVTEDVNAVPMVHATTGDDALASIMASGFNLSNNSMYGKGVYFSDKDLSQSGGKYKTSLQVKLKPHKQLVLDSDLEVATALQKITGLSSGHLGSDKAREAFLSAGIGSLRFPVDGETYTVVLDPALIELPKSAPAGNSKLAMIPWDAQLLPDANSNAKSHNGQVAKIKAMAEAGDVAGLQAYVDAKAGAKQTYAKKQHLLAATALAALKEGGAPAAPAANPLTGMSAADAIAINTHMPQLKLKEAWIDANADKVGAQAEWAMAVNPAPTVVQDPAPANPERLPASQKKMIDDIAKWPDGKYHLKDIANGGNPAAEAYAKQLLAEMEAASAGKPKPPTGIEEHSEAGAYLNDAVYGLEHNDLPTLQDVITALQGDKPAPGSDADKVLQFAKDAYKHVAGAAPGASKPADPTAAELVPMMDAINSAGSEDGAKKAALRYLNAFPGSQLAINQVHDALHNAGHVGLATAFAKDGQPGLEAFTDAPAGPVKVQAAVYHNTQDGHSKFWAVSALGNVVKTTYGKIGTKGSSTNKEMGSPEEATAYAVKLAKQKQANGYKLTSVTEHEHDAPAAKAAAPAAGAGAAAALQAVKDLWKKKVESGGANDIKQSLKAYEESNSDGSWDDLIAYGKQLLADPAADGGPKEGDTKQGADGMLVLKNGHWVKMSDDEIAAAVKGWKEAIVNEEVPTKAQAMVLEHIKSKDEDQFLDSLHESLPYAMSGDDDGFDAHAEQLYQQAMAAHKKALAGDASAKPAAVAPAPAAPSGSIEPMDGWKKVGGQEGYNEGGYFTDSSGQKWYCKFSGGGEEVARSEALALKLYALAGCDVPEVKLVSMGGKVGTASKVIDGLQQNKASLKAGSAHGIFSGFAADAWLANWDTVGNNPAAGKGFDNIQFTPDGKAWRIDAGGALAYKGTGAKKSAGEWGDKVIELKTLRDASINPNTAAAFGKMTDADVTASVKKVVDIPNVAIRALVNQFGHGSAAQKEALADKLIARKASMLAQYPKAAKKPKPKAGDASWVSLKPGEKIVETGEKFGVPYAKIEIPAAGFNLAGIPKPYEYNKSSSPHVNAANTADIKSIYDLAATGASGDQVKSMTFDQIVKATGEKTGKKLTIEEHPSKLYVQEYLNQVAAELSAQLNPTYRMEHNGDLKGSYDAAAAEIASLVGTLDYDQFASWGKKAADYLVLDQNAGDGIPKPEDGIFKNIESHSPELLSFKASSDAKYATLSSTEQKACKAYTGSAYVAWNEAMRTGDVNSKAFADSKPMRDAFDKAAVVLPAGIMLHRGINVGGDTYKSVVGAVIQDGSFQSCSFGSKAAFSSKTSQLRLHVTKGVKAVMATTFSHFDGAEREIILHPNTRYVVMQVGKENGKNVVDVLVLPHED